MAIYKVFSTFRDKAIRSDQYSGDGLSRMRADKETMESGNINGTHSKTLRGQTSMMSGILGGVLGLSIKGSQKTKAIAGTSAAIAGGIAGYQGQKYRQKRLLKNKKKNQRYLDNIKVSFGEMSEEDFNKKWKK